MRWATASARTMLMRIVLWWSACTALTGMVGLRVGATALGGLGTLVALRFLFGAGEAGAYPNITRALHNWFPSRSWETAQGLVFMSGRLMGGVTPLIWAILVGGTAASAPLMGWRGAFLLFGLVGVVWAVAFALWFRDRPEDHPDVNAAERLDRLGTSFYRQPCERPLEGDPHESQSVGRFASCIVRSIMRGRST